MQSMPNHSDCGIQWDYWMDLPPDGSDSNGEELVKGGMRAEDVDNVPQQCLGSANGK